MERNITNVQSILHLLNIICCPSSFGELVPEEGGVHIDTIHIVTAVNDHYARHLAIMLNSMLDHKYSANAVEIHILDGGRISSTSKDKLRKSIKKYNAVIKYIPVNHSLLNGVDAAKVYKRYGKEACYRIFIPDLSDINIQKALYMDCDIIVREDIADLWNTNLDNHFLAPAFC